MNKLQFLHQYLCQNTFFSFLRHLLQNYLFIALKLHTSIKWVSTLCPEGFPTLVTLVRPLIIVHTQMQVEVVFLRERVATYVTNKGTLFPVEQNQNTVLKKSSCGPVTIYQL